MQDLVDRYQPQRTKAWPEIEAFLKDLPAPLQDTGWQFAQRLARQTAPSGEFCDALKHPAAARVAYLPLWHINACLNQGARVENSDALGTHLFASAFLGFCAIRIHDDLIDEDKTDTPIDDLLLANLLSVEATRHLQRVFPSDSPFWDHHVRHWTEYTQAVRLDKMRDRGGLVDFTTDDLLHIGRKAALLKTYPVAVALCSGRENQIGLIETMMDAFNTAIQINNDIQSIKSDLEIPHYTPPLAAAALAVGFKPETHPTKEELLGSLILSPALADSHQVARDYYLRARNASAELGIDDLTAFIDWHIDDLQKSAERWSEMYVDVEQIPASFLDVLGSTGIADLPSASLTRALDMALAFLRFDPACRESWEIQRTGIWERDSLVGDVFSRSLVCEALAAGGCAGAGQAEDILDQYQKNGWRYYRDFRALPPDIDDLAQAIRLLGQVDWDEETKRTYLSTPMRWLARNRTGDGGFPVWMTAGVEDQSAQGWIPLGGMHCLACEANLLAALADRREVEQNWLEEGIANLLDRWVAQRYTGIYYYKPTHGAFLVARCFARFSNDSRFNQQTKDRLSCELQKLGDRHGSIKAGEDCLAIAAKLRIAALMPKPPLELIAQGLSALIDKQSFDGGWDSIAFFRCPGTEQRSISWHGGRMLTTAQAASAILSSLSTRH